MSKKYTISGYYGFNNFGDELILSELCEKLKKENAEIMVFSVSPEETSKKYGVKSSPTFNLINAVKEIFKTDALISGGGSLFQDSTSIKSLLYYAFVLFTAQLFGKETIVFRQGVGPLNNPLSKFLVKHLFKKATCVSVRDENSLKLLQNWGINAELKDDPIWEIQILPNEKQNILGVQLRECADMNDSFLKNLADAVVRVDPPEIKLFSLQKKLDYEICEKFEILIKENLPDLKISIVENNLLNELTSVKTLIGMRYHALIVGIKSGAKCVGINYDPKIESLSEKCSIPLIEIKSGMNEIFTILNNL